MQITFPIQFRFLLLISIAAACTLAGLVWLYPSSAELLPLLWLGIAATCLIAGVLGCPLVWNKVRKQHQTLHFRSGFRTAELPLADIRRLEHLTWAEWHCGFNQPLKPIHAFDFLDSKLGWFIQTNGRMVFAMIFADAEAVTVLHGFGFDVMLSGVHQLDHLQSLSSMSE